MTYHQAHSASYASPLTSRARRRRARASSLSPSAARLRSSERREVARLRAHFRVVLAELAQRDISALTPSQRAARASLVAELRRYARRGRFPRNLDFAGQRMPYFVDAFGTRCAMAHLIEHSGAVDFVQRIAAQKNNAFIREIEGDPELVEWLSRAGLSAAEAARIQPSYCDLPLTGCVCGHQTTSTGPLLEVTVTGRDGEELLVGKVAAIHWQQEAPPGEVMGNYAVGIEVVTWGGDAEPGDTVLVFANDNPTEAKHTIGPGILIQDGVATEYCSQDTPTLTKKDAVKALMKMGSACDAEVLKLDPAWSETYCVDNNGCSIGFGQSASVALPGLLGLIAVVWAGRRAARRRYRVSARRRRPQG